MRRLCMTICSLLLSNPALWAVEAGPFDLMQLPRGRAVTLPHPAVTRVPATTAVQVAATDGGQTLKLLALPQKPGAHLEKPLRVAIYDSKAEKVQYLDVNSRNPALYVFKSRKAIRLVPEPQPMQVKNAVWLRIESNRPLEIAR